MAQDLDSTAEDMYSIDVEETVEGSYRVLLRQDTAENRANKSSFVSRFIRSVLARRSTPEARVFEPMRS